MKHIMRFKESNPEEGMRFKYLRPKENGRRRPMIGTWFIKRVVERGGVAGLVPTGSHEHLVEWNDRIYKM